MRADIKDLEKSDNQLKKKVIDDEMLVLYEKGRLRDLQNDLKMAREMKNKYSKEGDMATVRTKSLEAEWQKLRKEHDALLEEAEILSDKITMTNEERIGFRKVLIEAEKESEGLLGRVAHREYQQAMMGAVIENALTHC